MWVFRTELQAPMTMLQTADEVPWQLTTLTTPRYALRNFWGGGTQQFKLAIQIQLVVEEKQQMDLPQI